MVMQNANKIVVADTAAFLADAIEQYDIAAGKKRKLGEEVARVTRLRHTGKATLRQENAERSKFLIASADAEVWFNTKRDLELQLVRAVTEHMPDTDGDRKRHTNNWHQYLATLPADTATAEVDCDGRE